MRIVVLEELRKVNAELGLPPAFCAAGAPEAPADGDVPAVLKVGEMVRVEPDPAPDEGVEAFVDDELRQDVSLPGWMVNCLLQPSPLPLSRTLRKTCVPRAMFTVQWRDVTL